jgi:lysophospholipase L1-like esterase
VKSPRRPSRLLSLAKFALIQAAVLFVILEAGLRVLRPVNHNVRVLLYMPTLVSAYDHVRTLPDLLNQSVMGFQPFQEFAGFLRNSRGFRTREYSAEKPPGTARIVAIGDSFTAECGGLAYSDMWHVLLERQLARTAGRPVEVLALGVPGVGPLFERRVWQLEGARLHADVMLLVLFVGNDFTDEYRQSLERNAGRVAARWSYTVRFFRNAARAIAVRRESGRLPAQLEGAGPAGTPRGGYELPDYRARAATRPPFLTHDRLMKVEAQSIRLCERAQGEAFEELFERLTSIVRDLRDEVEAAGVDFRVVVIPDRFQVNAGERAEVLALLGMTEAQFTDWDMPQRRLNGFFEEAGIRALDLLPAFREATEPTYAYDNTHWNVAGSSLAAARLAEWLEEDVRKE